jgi:fatty acid desaturase
MARDPGRAIPSVAVPKLEDLGLGHLQHVRAWTRRLFLVRPLVALAVVGWAALAGHLVLALAAIPLLYGWSLTLVHHMIHGSLQVSPPVRRTALTLGGVLALHSGHALRATHLQHHLTDLDSPDPEGEIELVPWPRMPVEAVLFRYRLWAWAWKDGHRRAWIAFEVTVHVAAMVWALTHLEHHLALVVLAVWIADVVFAVLAGKGPQANWGQPTPTPLVAIRCRLLRWLLLAHNWHLEHHLYPHVPLPYLAEVEPALDTLLADRSVLVKTLP